MEGVGANAQVERVLSAGLDHVLVGANASGLKGLRAQLLVLVGHHVDAEREVIDGSLLATKIEDANLGVGDTTVEPGLGVGLVKKVMLAMYSVMCMLETYRVSQEALKVVPPVVENYGSFSSLQTPVIQSCPSSNLPDDEFHVSIRRLMTLLWCRRFTYSIMLVRLQTFRDGFDSRPKNSQVQHFRDGSRLPCSCSSGSNEPDDEPF